MLIQYKISKVSKKKSARKLIKLIASAAEEGLQMLSEEEVRKELIGSVAIAVQKGNANIMLAEYHRHASIGQTNDCISH